MEKIINLAGEINGECLEEFTMNVINSDFAPEDTCVVNIDSPGGSIDHAFAMADVLKNLKEAGCNVKTINRGKVWSSAIVPYLEGDERQYTDGSSFLVHPVMLDLKGDIQLDVEKLEDMKREVVDFGDKLAEFYLEKQIPEEIAQHLYTGSDVMITTPEQMKAANFITTEQPLPKATNFKKFRQEFIERVFPAKPLYYISNNKQLKDQLKQNIMTDDKVINEIIESPKFHDALKNAFNEVIEEKFKGKNLEEEVKKETELLNEGTPLTDEEAKEFAKAARKTEVTVEGQPEIKWLAHPGKDLEKDHYVVPISKDGKLVALPEGDYRIEADGDKFVVHSTGIDWYIHRTGEGDDLKKNEGLEEKTKTQPVNETEIEVKKTMPVNKKGINLGGVNERVKRYYELAKEMGGKSAVGH